MTLSIKEKRHIKEIIKTCLLKKLSSYKRESKHMPFHEGLLGEDRMALFSAIQSLNSSFGKSIYEPVAKELAKPYFKVVETQYKLPTTITEKAQTTITKIINRLTSGGVSDKTAELEAIRKVSTTGRLETLKPAQVDLFLISHDDEVFMFDIKTVKPNKGEFQKYKQTLLDWAALYLYENPDAIINTLIAIPYNPYHPDEYIDKRWTMMGMLDLNYDVLIAEDFWDFLAEEGTYNDIINCFEKAGNELRPEIDRYFSTFKP